MKWQLLEDIGNHRVVLYMRGSSFDSNVLSHRDKMRQINLLTAVGRSGQGLRWVETIDNSDIPHGHSLSFTISGKSFDVICRIHHITAFTRFRPGNCVTSDDLTYTVSSESFISDSALALCPRLNESSFKRVKLGMTLTGFSWFVIPCIKSIPRSHSESHL